MTHNHIPGSKAEEYHSSLNIEPWIIHSPNIYNYTFTLASNKSMRLTTQSSMENIIIDTAKDSLQTWFLQTANVDTSNLFTATTTPPSLTSFYYLPPTNRFPFNNGNCTWWAYGRANEILNYKPDFNGNAEDFWNYRNSYLYYGYSETVLKSGSVVV